MEIQTATQTLNVSDLVARLSPVDPETVRTMGIATKNDNDVVVLIENLNR